MECKYLFQCENGCQLTPQYHWNTVHLCPCVFMFVSESVIITCSRTHGQWSYLTWHFVMPECICIIWSVFRVPCNSPNWSFPLKLQVNSVLQYTRYFKTLCINWLLGGDVLWCFSRNWFSLGLCTTHCKTAFIKQVFPKLVRPNGLVVVLGLFDMT